MDFAGAPPKDADIFCPLCEYNLRGLATARCPECGATFDWADLRDPARRIHPFLFEHHPERNVWSFLRTLFAGLHPGRFWQELLPSQPSRPRRLVLYWLICIAIALVSLTMQFVPPGMNLNADNRVERSYLTNPANSIYLQGLVQQGNHLLSPQAYLDAEYPLAPSGQFFEELLTGDKYQHRAEWWARCYMQCALMFAWPLAVVAILMTLRVTMRRAQVRPIHLLRVAIYCDDLIVWFSLLALIPAAMQAMNTSDAEMILLLFGMAIGIAIWQTYRLGRAISRYLRFRHAAETAIAVEFIFFLAALKVYLMAIGY